MRGRAKKQASMLAFINPETLIPADHPLRTIKCFADTALLQLSSLFDELYAADGQGRASIPPERLLKASLLISLYSVRSERAFCEELTYHLLFRWFLVNGHQELPGGGQENSPEAVSKCSPLAAMGIPQGRVRIGLGDYLLPRCRAAVRPCRPWPGPISRCPQM
jgi:Transposase domain (DUF772)